MKIINAHIHLEDGDHARVVEDDGMDPVLVFGQTVIGADCAATARAFAGAAVAFAAAFPEEQAQ